MKEKSPIEKNAEIKQIDLLSEALNGAPNANGYWMNASGKGYPKFYPHGVSVSPFNGLFMALHSDRNGCKTNLFTLYSDAKARGTSVREHEQVDEYAPVSLCNCPKSIPAHTSILPHRR